MTTYVALLRAVNVGGTGALPMQRLQALCAAAGLRDVRTYIQSGNVVFGSDFQDAEPAQVGVTFMAEPAPDALLAGVKPPGREQLRLGRREVYVHYPDGMGRSKLKLPSLAASGTVRNLNTVAKLVAMAGL